MEQSLKSYRKVFSDYQEIIKRDVVRTTETAEREKYGQSLLETKKELEQQLGEVQKELDEAKQRQKQLQEETRLTENQIREEQEQQEVLWRETCRNTEISEAAARWLESGEVRTGSEILQSLDKKLDEIERIIAGYITAQEKDMSRIAEIIDDPGR